MEIALAEWLMFAAAFVVLFFLPGHILLRRRPAEEKFVASAAISFAGALLLSKTIGLNAISITAFLVAAIIISAFLSASLE